MPRKINQPNPDPTVQAARVTSRRALIAAIVVALITAGGAIFVTMVNNRGSESSPPPRSALSPEKKSFSGRVVNRVTGSNVGGAKVSLEGEGVPPFVYTDSEGIFSFPLSDATKEYRLRIEAKGYENFDLRVTPAKSHEMQEIRLAPKEKDTAHRVSAGKFAKEAELAPQRTATLAIRGLVVDAQSGKPIEHAQVCIKGDCRTKVFTSEDGEFSLNSNGTKEKEFKLIVSRQGYATQEPWYDVGDNNTIYLVRNSR